ncbi:zf-HC2 domain-containing protein [Streptantibioticus rubrisoli]|uniref:Zf-HC2 domain-containing protein n=1 Tax=Streptantibioticus rubrisoli TaxID=1387313 RepID=A0ABT1PLJ4_9ACTN|nr:zf-HC2 domain-containing protein [Streptantibioticus rubrisoli]MCQ4045118.1 zf-HC2 domain-containing protein [Streptantibioticus rubrisoli]
MSTDHASMRLIDEYAVGDVTMAADTVWALEAHLETCAPCRSRLAACVATEAPGIAALVDTVRAGLEPQLDAAGRAAPSRRHRPRWVSSWLTPGMTPWLAMTVVVTLMALLLDAVASPSFFGDASPVLLIAPVLPLCGVAASWSRGLDPAHELTASTARAGLPLLLRRTTAVLVVVLPGLLVGGWLTGTMTAAQWLLPSLAFTSTALALGSVVGVTRAATGLAVAWGVVVVVPAWATGHVPLALRLVLQPDQLPGWGLLLALGIGAVIARRNAYSTL